MLRILEGKNIFFAAAQCERAFTDIRFFMNNDNDKNNIIFLKKRVAVFSLLSLV